MKTTDDTEYTEGRRAGTDAAARVAGTANTRTNTDRHGRTRTGRGGRSDGGLPEWGADCANYTDDARTDTEKTEKTEKTEDAHYKLRREM